MVQKPKDASDKPLEVINENPKEQTFQLSTHLTKMQKRYAENEALLIKPCGWVSPAGRPNPKFEKERAKAWEYVVGVVESKEGISPLLEHEMAWCEWAGDPITTWKIPTGRLVAIPRGVAKEIKEGCKWTAYVTQERQVGKVDKHGDYLTSWKAEEIRKKATFELAQNL